VTNSLRLATPDDAERLAALAAITFPRACPPGSDPAAVAEHIRTQLSPARFVAWARSADHALLLAEVTVPSSGTGDSPDGSSTGRADSASDSRLVGYALLVRGVPDDQDIVAVVGDEPTVELSKIYVHPGSQGTGVASDLMRAALDAAPGLVPDRAVWLGADPAGLHGALGIAREPYDDIRVLAAAVAGGGGADGLKAPPAMVDPGADPLTSGA